MRSASCCREPGRSCVDLVVCRWQSFSCLYPSREYGSLSVDMIPCWDKGTGEGDLYRRKSIDARNPAFLIICHSERRLGRRTPAKAPSPLCAHCTSAPFLQLRRPSGRDQTREREGAHKLPFLQNSADDLRCSSTHSAAKPLTHPRELARRNFSACFEIQQPGALTPHTRIHTHTRSTEVMVHDTIVEYICIYI